MNSDTLHEVIAMSQLLFSSDSQQLTASTQQAAWQLLWVGTKGNTCITPMISSVKTAVYFQVVLTGV